MNDNPTRPCGRCGDTDRFNDNGDSVCSTCGLTRPGAATAPDEPRRRTVRVTIDIDMPVTDLNEIVIQGRASQSGDGEWDVDPPVDRREVLEGKVWRAVEDAIGQGEDGYIYACRVAAVKGSEYPATNCWV